MRLNQNGAKAAFVFLGDRGIKGNRHTMMLETDNDELAASSAETAFRPNRQRQR
jgi:hypothetical protein